MASTIKVDKIEGSTGSTVTVPTGQTFTVTDGLAIGSIPTITVAKGGTNTTSYTAGDVLYASGATTLTKLAKPGTPAGEVLTFATSASAPSWVAPAGGGKMGQMVSTQLVLEQSTTSASFVAITGVTNTITPTATSSKVWVQGNLFWGRSTNNTMWMQMYRDAVLINEQTFSSSDGDTYFGSGVDSGYYFLRSAPFSFLDSPSTTSATVYTIKWKSDGNTVYLNRIGGDTNQAGASQLNTIEVLA